jgi:hypothetical protein
MCSKFNPLVVFALDLMSAYEGEHTIFGLLGQANLNQNDVLQFHLFHTFLKGYNYKNEEMINDFLEGDRWSYKRSMHEAFL